MSGARGMESALTAGACRHSALMMKAAAPRVVVGRRKNVAAQRAALAQGLDMEVCSRRMDQEVMNMRQGRLVEGGIVYRQTLVVRSYEVGADKTASLQTFLNHFQDSALNHVWMSGLLGDGFGATHGMMRNQLIWVVTKMQVEVEKYPTWGDVLELDTWVGASGKNGMRRDWLVHDFSSGEIVARATSTWVMMNERTRRLSKIPDEVRAEISPWFLDQRCAIKGEQHIKVNKVGDDDARYVHSNLEPRRTDLDMNQHVNNVKYVGWMLETVPTSIQECYELQSITLEYRRECGKGDIVQSLTSCIGTSSNSQEAPTFQVKAHPSSLALNVANLTLDFVNVKQDIFKLCRPLEYMHLLRLQSDGAEIVRGQTRWRLKASKS